MGSEDPLQISFKGHLFKRGQVEHVLTMANLKLKPSLFMPRPIIQNTAFNIAHVHMLSKKSFTF